MNRDQITEIFLKAAEADRKLPNSAKPATLKAMNFGYVHTVAEMNGWHAEDKHAANWAWLNPDNLRNTTNDMGLWLASMELIKLVRNEDHRRSLWAWARSQVGSGRFAKWCRRVEGISPQLGNWRKNMAISQIERAFASKPLLHNDKAEGDAFTNTPEISDKRDNISAWRDYDPKDMMRCHFDDHLVGVSIEEIQSAKRREREARRKKAA